MSKLSVFLANDYVKIIAPWFFELMLILLIFFITWLVAKILNKLVLKLIAKLNSKCDLLKFITQAVNIVCWSIGVITVLGTLNVDVSALIAGLGLTGFAVGFACKDLLANALSGLIIMLYSPFTIGSKVKVKGTEGEVSNIDFRYTTLTNNNNNILIPNALMLNEVVFVDHNS